MVHGYKQRQRKNEWCFFIEVSYIRVLKRIELRVGVKIRIDYKWEFLMRGFLVSDIICKLLKQRKQYKLKDMTSSIEMKRAFEKSSLANFNYKPRFVFQKLYQELAAIEVTVKNRLQ